MYLQLIVSSVLINFISAGEVHFVSKNAKQNKALVGSSGTTNTFVSNNAKDNKALVGSSGTTNTTPYNFTYIDKAENLIRLPAMNKYYLEKKGKKNSFKKSPKRTIQKIIKKNTRSKIKKLYVLKMTSSHPTMAPKFDFDNEQDDNSARKAEMTTRSHLHKKMKKFSVKQIKLPRYPMPYRKTQTRKNNYKRPKRDTRDIFIFKDFDSMQFVKGKKDDDYNVVNAHFQNSW